MQVILDPNYQKYPAIRHPLCLKIYFSSGFLFGILVDRSRSWRKEPWYVEVRPLCSCLSSRLKDLPMLTGTLSIRHMSACFSQQQPALPSSKLTAGNGHWAACTFICGVSQIRSPKSPNLLISISWLQDMTWKHDPKMTAKTNLWAATSWFNMGFPFWIKIIRNLGRSNPFHNSTTTKKKHLSMTPLREKKSITPHPDPSKSVSPLGNGVPRCSALARSPEWMASMMARVSWQVGNQST